MKVADVMQRHVDSVGIEDTVMDAARIIFGRNINGVPICKNKKVVGFVTERDILANFLPSMQDYVEDPFREGDFEKMEDKAKEILSFPVSKIMSRTPTTIEADTPILHAQSLMTIHKIGRLPVVDHRGNLIGIIAKGDIFKAVVGKNIPYSESEEYHDWIAKHFDIAIGMESRIKPEVESLTKLFRNNKVKKVLDIGYGTGEHSINLAKNGFNMVGIENSRLMFNVAKEKWDNLAPEIKNRVEFVKGDFVGALKTIDDKFDAAIFMGDMLAHMPYKYLEVLEELKRILSKDALIVAQLVNFEKSITVKKRLRRFEIAKSKVSPDWEHAYYWFYDPPRKKGDLLVLNAAILDFNGKIWLTRSMNRLQTMPFTKIDLTKIFKKAGFPRISFYGIEEWEDLFAHSFKLYKSDYLIVVAKR